MGAVIEAVGDRPAVIIDDDFGFYEKDWAVQRTEDGTPTLVLSPDYETGLTLAHVQSALSFDVRLRQGESSSPSPAV